MRSTVRPLRPAAVIVGTAFVVLWLAAAPVFSKEGMEARLDAPIAMGTPGGTEILVGVSVTVFDQTGAIHPVEGTPVYLRLIGRDGSSTRAAGAADPAPGHYTMRIAIPEGGARDIEIGIHGTSDLAIMVMNEPFVFGGITASTAQVAPPRAPALTPLPRMSSPVVVAAPVAEAAAPGAEGAGAPSPAAQPTGLVALVVAGLLAAGIAIVAVRRRTVSGTPPPPPAKTHRAPGA
ncbi:MAG TPA: hypothetical protein VGK16_13250 [Candidatus Limnocylindrales bacterium]|jgi:hypothetical protein